MERASSHSTPGLPRLRLRLPSERFPSAAVPSRRDSGQKNPPNILAAATPKESRILTGSGGVEIAASGARASLLVAEW